jgi:hypothetical protein
LQQVPFWKKINPHIPLAALSLFTDQKMVVDGFGTKSLATIIYGDVGQ